jgi:DNA polymerase I-like protein with 3'-5' exonuclease and polymerase domains
MSFEYKLLSYLIQGSGADAMKESIIRWDEVKGKDSRMLVTVYDENNISAPKKAMKKEMKILKDVMEGLEFDVPMLTDVEYGRSWGELEEALDAVKAA